MGAMKRELMRVAEVILTGDYETITEELKKIERLDATAGTYAMIFDTAKAMAPLCKCGNDYFEGIKQ